ncbi:ABC transporter permease [Xanthomonas campestris pv. cannae]|nr:ABC transporter permease [Xanthomonas campestris pv. cannae]
MRAIAATSLPRLRRALGRLGIGGGIAALLLLGWTLAALFGPRWVAPAAAEIGAGAVFAPAGAAHWLGTDYLGRDMLAMLVLGARYTLGLAAAATLLACTLGTTLALLAAAAGRWVDTLLSRALDTLTSIPSKLFALLMVAAFGASLPLLVLAAAIIYVPGAYRIARALAVNVAAMDYVTVAATRGEGLGWLMGREILPNIIGPILVDLGLRFVYVVLLLASLSFLGLGVQPPAADWGTLVRDNLGVLAEGGVAVLAPALAIASLTVSVNLLIDRLSGRRESR